jgi:hypothetical protein
MALGLPKLDKAVLQGPDAVARAAASRTQDPQKRWLLRQARAVRSSYARNVLDGPGQPSADEIWMLRQPKPVRESYIREVLRADRSEQRSRRSSA